jgi:hypothetical protein
MPDDTFRETSDQLNASRLVSCNWCKEKRFRLVRDLHPLLQGIASVWKEDQSPMRAGGLLTAVAVECGKCKTITCLWCATKDPLGQGKRDKESPYQTLVFLNGINAYIPSDVPGSGYFCPNCGERVAARHRRQWWQFWR